MTVTSLDLDAVDLPVPPVRRDPETGRPRGWTTPRRIRVLAAVSVLLALVFATVVEVGAGGLRGAFREIGHRAGPQVVATSDLYFALNDMDAQVANVLLVGKEQGLGVGRDQALNIYAQRRAQADRDLQQASSIAGGDRAAAEALRAVLDGFGKYQALAAEAILLDGQHPHPAAQPPADALARYRQATDMMKQQVLPAAEKLRTANADALEHTYESKHTATDYAMIATGVVGALLASVLVGLQAYLARRLRRRINPLLALATAGVVVLTLTALGMLGSESEHLRRAKKDAFDSVLVLARARAISYDANADESRFMVDPARRAQYQLAFYDKSQDLLGLPNAGSVYDYDQEFATTIGLYRSANPKVAFTGLMGRELHNITFAGEREAADDALSALQIYQRDDREMRRRVGIGQLKSAVDFNTSYKPGNSNWAFDQYDKALVQVTDINQRAFDQSIHAGEDGLSAWTWIPPAALLAVAGLVFLAVRPRLSEYR
ncbi:hypothetical protein J4573_43330 [Actinomadura barringtoniae]|uniref:Secreted protein n=1 Tax=Actinomadura barringtoniae TaxID=1427535 RepID=A0A939T988_9ACTN|nr:hypothetical protein [Actinomadura barringtoniae]MBO2453984.1 hypothetical protein [Actinomadura barringtoniae]